MQRAPYRFRVIGIRSTLASLSRATKQQMNRVLPVRGINIGGGAWVRLGWYNADTRHSLDGQARVPLDRQSRLPFADGTIARVFSSHFFEHVDDETAAHLFGEAFRVLRADGVFRISVPDFELALRRYVAGDDAFFDEGDVGLAPRYENWRAHGMPVTLENKLSFLFFCYANRDDDGRWPPWRFDPAYYCGPAPADAEQIGALARQGDVAGLNRYLVGCKPPEAIDLGHINWWTEDKFRALLSRAGFSRVVRSSYRASSVAELREAEFDNRPALSLFVEAFK